MRNKAMELLLGAAILGGAFDTRLPELDTHITERKKPVSKGVDLGPKKYKARKKRMKMQKQSRKINRA